MHLISLLIECNLLANGNVLYTSNLACFCVMHGRPQAYCITKWTDIYCGTSTIFHTLMHVALVV